MNRRVKVAYVDEHVLLDVLNAFKGCSAVMCPVFDGVPVGAVVERVWACSDRRAIGLLVSHPSFDEVPAGENPPGIGNRLCDMVGKRIIRVEEMAARIAESASPGYVPDKAMGGMQRVNWSDPASHNIVADLESIYKDEMAGRDKPIKFREFF